MVGVVKLLTPAEADALAARFRPTRRTGVTSGTALTREAHDELAADKARPLTDTEGRKALISADGFIPVTRIGGVRNG